MIMTTRVPSPMYIRTSLRQRQPVDPEAPVIVSDRLLEPGAAPSEKHDDHDDHQDEDDCAYSDVHASVPSREIRTQPNLFTSDLWRAGLHGVS